MNDINNNNNNNNNNNLDDDDDDDDVCRTKSLEQSPVFTARTHRHKNFQTQTKDLSFSARLSVNLCSFIRLVLFLFYFSTRYVIRWSILFCKRNSLWTMNYELWPGLNDDGETE